MQDDPDITLAIGKTIMTIVRGDMLIDGTENDEDLGPLEIGFTDGSFLQIELIGDGESVTYAWRDHRPPVLSAESCEWERIDLHTAPPFNELVGQRVTTVDILLFGISGEASRVIAGVGIYTDQNRSIVYYNGGDFAKIFLGGDPPPLPKGFNLAWKSGRCISPIKKSLTIRGWTTGVSASNS